MLRLTPTETEAYDILSEYYIALLENKPAEGDSIEVIETKGIGGYFDHARNQLEMTVMNLENRYSYSKKAIILLPGDQIPARNDQRPHQRMATG
ncbi:MAG: hypothetical protein U0Z17_09335 [Bacteroidales bacterium]